MLLLLLVLFLNITVLYIRWSPTYDWAPLLFHSCQRKHSLTFSKDACNVLHYQRHLLPFILSFYMYMGMYFLGSAGNKALIGDVFWEFYHYKHICSIKPGKSNGKYFGFWMGRHTALVYLQYKTYKSKCTS